jgi:1-hydroxycarotenoid 3,4-desaturase
VLGAADGFPLLRHNVFFSADHSAEFSALRRGPAPDPTVYVCAQDRDDSPGAKPAERLLLLINSPAMDTALSEAEIDACLTRTLARLADNGLNLVPQALTATTPARFTELFPATGGALYGRATHGWAATFLRPGAASRLPGLYLAGGAVHPGPGVPMAVLSGRSAAQRILSDRASTSPFRRGAMRGGTSTHSAPIAPAA